YAGAAASRSAAIYSLRALAGHGIEFVRVSATGEPTVLHRVPEGKRGARRTLIAAAPILDEERQSAYFVDKGDAGACLTAWSIQNDAIAGKSPQHHGVQATPSLRPDGVIVIPDLGGVVQAVQPDGSQLFEYRSGCEYLLAGAVADQTGRVYLGDPL